MSKLDDIYDRYVDNDKADDAYADSFKQAIKDLMLGIVKEHSIDGVWCESLALEEATNSL